MGEQKREKDDMRMDLGVVGLYTGKEEYFSPTKLRKARYSPGKPPLCGRVAGS